MRKQLHIILRLVMFCCILLFVSQEVSAQITFSVKNQTIRQTIRVIEKKADYSFFYTDKLPGLDQKISLKVDNESIDSVLEKVFKGSPISYKIESGKQVVLTLKTEQNASRKGDKKTITGVVADRRGEPLIGVTVRVEGENIGTATDIDGRFSLEAPIGAKISFSYIGYVSQSHTVNKQNIYNVSLSEDSQVLEEVVVVGYGSMKRKDITTAVSVVSTADIEERPIMTAAQAIQGKAAGIQVVQPSGMPGSGVTIRVRGATSVQASNEPLYVVDGLPSDDISNISPNDIESMQILKDASSAAIYGNLDTLPLDESMIGMPTSFYGLTKLTTEHYLRIYYEAHGLNYICYRYSNVYGPRQGNGGEGGVISIFAKAIANGLPITVYGDGDQTRDFIYVDDVVEANILGLENNITGVYNISTNIASSINLIIDEFKCISNSKIDVSYEPERIGDIRHSRLDNKKAQKDFSFKTTFNLSDGLYKTYEYFKVNK